MYKLQTFVTDSLNLFTTIGLADIIDILIITFVIFEASVFIRKTNSSKIAKGVLVLLLALLLSDFFGLVAVNYFLRSILELGFIAIIVLFQPEIRRILEKLGTSRFKFLDFFSGTPVNNQGMEQAITQTVLACRDLAKTKTGALIIFERDNKLSGPVSTGTIINADPTAELFKNIFYPKAPLHDGAVIVCDGRIAAAGCMLPLSNNTNLSKELGMRHRAGIGMSEQSDAVVVIVSEETGAISVAVEGMLKRHLTPETCERLLRNELITEADQQNVGLLARVGMKLKGGRNDEKSDS